MNPAENPEAEEDVDLFGSDDEEDEEAARVREERLAEYRKKKENKPKVVAKSVVTMEIKPWGKLSLCPVFRVLRRIGLLVVAGSNHPITRRRDRHEGP